MENNRVLVLGGAGFVGSATTHELLHLGYKPCVFDNLLHGIRSNIPSNSLYVSGDLIDGWSLLHCMKDFKPDYVINFVGDTYIPTSYNMPSRFIDINIYGVYNVLRACSECSIKKLIHISTAEVYGNKNTALNEESSINFANTYAVTKIAGDGLCQTFACEHNTPVNVVRLFNCYGPRPTEPYVISDIIKQLHTKDVVELGNVNAIRDFTYVHDSAKAIISLLLSDVKAGETFNLGSGISYSISDIFYMLCKIMNKKHARYIIDSSRLRKKDIDSIYCDNKKLVSLTNWKPCVSILEGLEMTVKWFYDNGCKWSWEEFTEGAKTLK